MDITQAIDQFMHSPAGQAVLLMALLAVLDFALGTFRAIQNGTFQLDALAAWLRKHIAGRVLPTFAVLIVGHIAGGLTVDDGVAGILSPGTILTGIGIAMATAYILETIGSLRATLDSSAGDTVPTD
jgi:type IV secretory pathway VirB2 component (pilin)